MTKKKKAYTFRKFTNDIHLWMGIGSGIILFLVCLSGTFLTFEEELKALTVKEFKIENTAKHKKSFETLITNLSQEGIINRVTVPDDNSKPLEFNIKTSPKERRGSTFYVDPYSGNYEKAQKSYLDGFFMTMFKMHRWLLLDTKIGRPIVGVATIIFLFLAISGVILWFPKKWKWKAFKPGFKIKFSANWKRINHDLHNTLGFYACIFLVIMCLTGLCWSFVWYKDAGSAVLGAKVFGNRGGGQTINSQVTNENEQIPVENILSIANDIFDYEGNTTITLPKTATDTYSITKRKVSGWSPVTTDKLIIDIDGTVLKEEWFNDKPLNVQIASLIKPIHTGQIFGTFSKIIYFIACLIATSLPITGTIIWLNKLKKKRKRKLKK